MTRKPATAAIAALILMLLPASRVQGEEETRRPAGQQALSPTRLNAPRLDENARRRLLTPVSRKYQTDLLKRDKALWAELVKLGIGDQATETDDWQKGIVLTPLQAHYVKDPTAVGFRAQIETMRAELGPGAILPIPGSVQPFLRLCQFEEDSLQFLRIHLQPPTPGVYALTFSMKPWTQGAATLVPRAIFRTYPGGQTTPTEDPLPVTTNAGATDSDQFTVVVTVPDPVPALPCLLDLLKPQITLIQPWRVVFAQVTIRKL